MNAPVINVADVVRDIVDAVKGVVQSDLPTLNDFVKAQLEGMAEQAALVAKGLAVGWIDTDEERRHWADTLRHMAVEFARTLRALVVIVVEKAINAVIAVFQSLFQRVAGAVLPF